MPEFVSGTVEHYLTQLASGAPTPGGGSAAGLTGAMSAALLAMSARFTVGREKYAAYEARAQAVLDEAELLRNELQALVEEDAAAYGQYRAAVALPKTTEEDVTRRREALQAATCASATVPFAIATKCHRLLVLADALADQCNPYLVSDVVVAAHLALGAFRSALINVRINLATLEDTTVVDTMEATLAPQLSSVQQLADHAIQTAYRIVKLSYEGDFPA
jgi:formiminotetrahydrofolate cyclodeaminase